MHSTFATFSRYLGVGVINTCVGLGLIYLGLYVFDLDDIAANLIGYTVGIAVSFLLNKYWTFSNFQAAGPQLAKFLLVTAAAYVVNLAVVEVCIKLLGIDHYIAQAAGVIPYTIVGYAGSRFFAFRA